MDRLEGPPARPAMRPFVKNFSDHLSNFLDAELARVLQPMTPVLRRKWLATIDRPTAGTSRLHGAASAARSTRSTTPTTPTASRPSSVSRRTVA